MRVIHRQLPVPIAGAAQRRGPAGAHFGDHALHGVQGLFVAACVVFQFVQRRCFIELADVTEQFAAFGEHVDQAHARVDGFIGAFRVALRAAGGVHVAYFAASGDRLGAIDQRPAVGEIPAVHDEHLKVVGLVVHLGVQVLAEAGGMGVIAALNPGVAVVQPDQQVVVSQHGVVAHGAAENGLVVVDQQAEERRRHDRVIQRLVLERETHHQTAGVVQRPFRAVGRAPGFHVVEKVTAHVVGVGLVGIVLELVPRQGAGQLLVVVHVAQVEPVFHAVTDLPAGIGVKAASLLLLVIAVAVVAALLGGDQGIEIAGHRAAGHPALHGAVAAAGERHLIVGGAGRGADEIDRAP